MVEALLAAEQVARHARSSVTLDAIDGRWRLSFVTTGTRKARSAGARLRGWYVPRLAAAHIAFIPSAAASSAAAPSAIGTITNQLQIGAGQLQFSGFCRAEGKKNLVAFDFMQMQLRLFDRQMFQVARRGDRSAAEFAQQAIAKLPFFTFFVVTDEYLAARGRGGGLAIWVRAALPAPSQNQ